jgi:hypothetical protein
VEFAIVRVYLFVVNVLKTTPEHVKEEEKL